MSVLTLMEMFVLFRFTVGRACVCVFMFVCVLHRNQGALSPGALGLEAVE